MPDEMDFLERQTFGDVLREMDLEHLVMGEYGITVEEAAKFVDHDHFQFLDLRTKEEHDHLLFPFPRKLEIWSEKRISRPNLRRTCFLLNACFPTLPR